MLARCRKKPKRTFVDELSRLFRKVFLKPRLLGFSPWREVL
jgi:hypothetical protein